MLPSMYGYFKLNGNNLKSFVMKNLCKQYFCAQIQYFLNLNSWCRNMQACACHFQDIHLLMSELAIFSSARWILNFWAFYCRLCKSYLCCIYSRKCISFSFKSTRKYNIHYAPINVSHLRCSVKKLKFYITQNKQVGLKCPTSANHWACFLKFSITQTTDINVSCVTAQWLKAVLFKSSKTSGKYKLSKLLVYKKFSFCMHTSRLRPTENCKLLLKGIGHLAWDRQFCRLHQERDSMRKSILNNSTFRWIRRT